MQIPRRDAPRDDNNGLLSFVIALLGMTGPLGMLEHDLAKCRVALEVAVGGGNLIESEHAIDDWPHDAARQEGDHLRREGAGRHNLLLERPSAKDGAA